jgi:ATP-binding cassette subfamily F protein uup
MEAAIERADQRQKAAEAALSDPATYTTTPHQISTLKAELADATSEIDRLFARWEELQSLSAKGQ